MRREKNRLTFTGRVASTVQTIKSTGTAKHNSRLRLFCSVNLIIQVIKMKTGCLCLYSNEIRPWIISPATFNKKKHQFAWSLSPIIKVNFKFYIFF